MATHQDCEICEANGEVANVVPFKYADGSTAQLCTPCRREEERVLNAIPLPADWRMIDAR